MRVHTVSSTLYMLFLLVGLTACTDRNMQIEFLSKNILSSYEFEVTNAVNGTDIVPVSSKVPFNVECSATVLEIEAYDQVSQTWKEITELDASAAFNCLDQQTAQFSLTYAQIGAIASPSTAGDQRKNIDLRLTVPSVTGSSSQYTKSYSVYFQAPTVTVTASDINSLSTAGTAGSTYSVSGTCSVNGGTVEVSAPFANTASGTCTSGVYNATLTLNAALADGTAQISAKHLPSSPYYVFNQADKTINIDRTVPVIAIAAPAHNSTISAAATTAGNFTVSGSCETGLTVTLTMSPSGTTTASCSAGAFSAQMPVTTQGAVTLLASQTDAAGNQGDSSNISLTIDTQAPTAPTGLGILAVSSSFDSTADEFLRDANPQVRFTGSSSASAGYSVQIKNSSSTVMCSNMSVSASTGTIDVPLTGCGLVNSSSYKIVVTASDLAGNQATSTSDFLVDYPVPNISNMIVTGVSVGTYIAEADLPRTVNFDFVFNRSIDVVGTPKITLNMGRVIDGLKTAANKIRFSYEVQSGEYAVPVNFSSTVITNATITDTATAVNANLTIPVSLYTSQYQFNVDTDAPDALLTYSLGAVTPYYNKTPAISYTLPTHPGTLSVQVDVTGTNVSQTFTSVANGSELTGLSLEKGTTYTLTAYVKDSVGNLSPGTPVTFDSFECPGDFLYIHNPAFGLTPFCIAPTEAKGSLAAVTFGYTGTPLSTNYTSVTAANMGCKSLGSDYDLPTNAEWNAVADLIAQRGSNWAWGIASTSDPSVTSYSNYIFTGYSGGTAATAATSIVDSDPCSPASPTGCGTASSPYRRSLYLPNVGSTAQKIWDFSGNMFELVKDLDTNIYAESDRLIMDIINTSVQTKYGATQAGSRMSCTHQSASAVPYCGFGSFNFICSEVDDPDNCAGTPQAAAVRQVVLRGGAASSTTTAVTGSPGTHLNNNAGIFAAYRILEENSAQTFNVGFRCVYHPPP